MKQKSLMVIMAALLSACASGEVRDTLGLDREAPDEFKVVSRPPLSVPPDFDLVTPDPGAAPRALPSTESQARALVLQGDDKQPGSTELTLGTSAVETAVDPVIEGELPSSAESSFLSRAGADKADPAIRKKIHEDVKIAPKAEEDVSPLEELMGIKSGDPVVDPKAEAKRIRKNKDQGKPVTAGKVKTIDPKKGSVLDRLF